MGLACVKCQDWYSSEISVLRFGSFECNASKSTGVSSEAKPSLPSCILNANPKRLLHPASAAYKTQTALRFCWHEPCHLSREPLPAESRPNPSYNSSHAASDSSLRHEHGARCVMINSYCDHEKQRYNCNEQHTQMFADILDDNERNDSDKRLLGT